MSNTFDYAQCSSWTESKDEILLRTPYGGNKHECFKSEIQNEILHPSATPSTALSATAYSGQASFVQNNIVSLLVDWSRCEERVFGGDFALCFFNNLLEYLEVFNDWTGIKFGFKDL